MIEPRIQEDIQALRQLPKLKSLLKKYRQLKAMQSGLLKLSELASTVTDMDSFYPALESVIKSLLITDSFHIVLADQQQHLSLVYCHNPVEKRLLDYFQLHHWQNSLTSVVFNEEDAIHCSSAERMALAKAGKIVLYGSSCVDWLGVPLVRGRQVIGVISLQSYDEKLYFDDRDCQLLAFISEHLVTAIDRVRSRELLEQSIQLRTKKLVDANERLQQEIAERQKAVKMHKALLAISEITAKSADIQSFYQLLHQKVNTIIQAKNFYIALLSDDQTQINFPYYNDEHVAVREPRKLANGLTELVLKKAQPLLLARGKITTLSDQGQILVQTASHSQCKGIRPQAWLAAPLAEQGKIFGVLAIQHYQDDGAYQESDLSLIRFVSQHISTAILRMRAQAKFLQSNEELERLVNERTQELQATNLNLRMQVEERRKAEAQLYHDAHHDALTKLPNRAMFSERLTYAIRHLKRHSNHRFAVLFIDLDRFKMINDTLGHHAGDQFLVEIGVRLRECVRDNDILARLGGDEFVVLLDSLNSTDDVEEIASRIIAAIASPFELDGHCLYSNASIGIALCNNTYNDANEILRDADAAMYQAKNLGRGRYVFFDESMREQLIATMTLEQELRIAIKEQQFELHYQKISDLEYNNTIGYEALLRWQHPSKGLLTPSEFLHLAEETGLILDIEIWVVEEVCRQLDYWESSSSDNNAFIAINLSGRHLTQANQLNKLIELIKTNIVEPQRLILEFNESAFSQHTDLALKGLRKLKEFGVKLALDDYGAGYSSFNFLHSYPFEFIKLDRAFISSLNTNDKNLSLVKALHELGDQFGYRLVAEGIESKEMLQKLQTVGCEFGQGYYINRPCKLAGAPNLLEKALLA
ncbi:EAL domain-containing protein [Colwelliaceae bacterium 6471]